MPLYTPRHIPGPDRNAWQVAGDVGFAVGDLIRRNRQDQLDRERQTLLDQRDEQRYNDTLRMRDEDIARNQANLDFDRGRAGYVRVPEGDDGSVSVSSPHLPDSVAKGIGSILASGRGPVMDVGGAEYRYDPIFDEGFRNFNRERAAETEDAAAAHENALEIARIYSTPRTGPVESNLVRSGSGYVWVNPVTREITPADGITPPPPEGGGLTSLRDNASWRAIFESIEDVDGEGNPVSVAERALRADRIFMGRNPTPIQGPAGFPSVETPLGGAPALPPPIRRPAPPLMEGESEEALVSPPSRGGVAPPDTAAAAGVSPPVASQPPVEGMSAGEVAVALAELPREERLRALSMLPSDLRAEVELILGPDPTSIAP